MTKRHIYIFLLTIAVLLMLGFAISLVADYVLYNSAQTSFPFYAYVIERAVEFLLPSLASLIVGLIIRHKSKKRIKT